MPNPGNDQSEQGEGENDNEPPSSPEGEEVAEPETPDDGSSNKASAANGEPSLSQDNSLSFSEVQKRAKDAAAELLEHSFDGIIKVESTDGEGWRTVVEVVERPAVPDTQDILGRYEISFDPAGNVTGYELLERYRRGDMKEEL